MSPGRHSVEGFPARLALRKQNVIDQCVLEAGRYHRYCTKSFATRTKLGGSECIWHPGNSGKYLFAFSYLRAELDYLFRLSSTLSGYISSSYCSVMDGMEMNGIHMR